MRFLRRGHHWARGLGRGWHEDWAWGFGGLALLQAFQPAPEELEVVVQ
jgi:hypothetical protein